MAVGPESGSRQPSGSPERSRSKSAKRDQPSSERERLQQGALKQLYEDYAAQIFAFARRLLGEASLAEDVVQETFIRVYQSQPKSPNQAYLFKTAHSIALNLIKRRKRHGPLSEQQHSEQQSLAGECARDVAQVVAQKELQHKVVEALQELAPEHRSVIVLRYYHSLTLKDMAEVLQCTERTLRNRLRAAAVLLERVLRDRGLVPEVDA